MKFTKMHGLGNDYVYVDLFRERVNDPVSLARAVSDRHTGVGGDGLILIGPSARADVRMEMYNADGSRAQVCGNGIRCVAKYTIEHGLAKGVGLRIETDAGVKRAECNIVDSVVKSVRVDMGAPSLRASDVGFHGGLLEDNNPERIIEQRLDLPGYEHALTLVSMGNPHAVSFVKDVQAFPLEALGPIVERAPQFPQRINLHVVRVDSPERVTMRTWERGSGLTKACGTGACAVCVAGVVTDRTGRSITVCLPGGELDIEWAEDDHVYMTGPAVEVFVGEWRQ